MKTKLVREHGKLTERFEIDNEPNYVYIKYFKGSFSNTAFILKNDPNAVHDYLEKLFKDYYVSPQLQKDVRNLFKQQVVLKTDSNWQEFVNFLTITLSLNLMVGVALGISIFGGYRLGELMDSRYHLDHTYTIFGGLFGLMIGALVGYVMIYHYFGKHSKKLKGKTAVLKKDLKKDEEWPIIDASLDDVCEAVRKFSEDLPEEMSRTFIVRSEDYSIDFQHLAAYLSGIPSKPFYMSKETFEIFEDKAIPPIIDKVQKAVYLYNKVNNKYPARLYDPLHRVNYDLLLQDHYLDEKPSIDLYYTDYDGLITAQKPDKKKVGG
jgi:hypothetical protein